jgi:hypothetical protein
MQNVFDKEGMWRMGRKKKEQEKQKKRDTRTHTPSYKHIDLMICEILQGNMHKARSMQACDVPSLYCCDASVVGRKAG